jgi:aryl-alcohol dehydrogenase-like predicted oxidoreductase
MDNRVVARARGQSSGDDDLVGLYLHDISAHPLLTREDEVRLGELVAEGKAAAVELATVDPKDKKRVAELKRRVR